MTSSSVGMRKFGIEKRDGWRLSDGMDEGVAACRRLIMKRERRIGVRLEGIRDVFAERMEAYG